MEKTPHYINVGTNWIWTMVTQFEHVSLNECDVVLLSDELEKVPCDKPGYLLKF